MNDLRDACPASRFCPQTHEKRKSFPVKGNSFACGQRDSNPHALRHQILSLTWLPITPYPQISEQELQKPGVKPDLGGA